MFDLEDFESQFARESALFCTKILKKAQKCTAAVCKKVFLYCKKRTVIGKSLENNYLSVEA